MIEVQIEFIAKTTIRIIAYIYDDDGALVDPTGCAAGGYLCVTLIITDPAGTVKVPSEGDGDDTMTRSAKGIYEYYYKTTTSSTKEWWHGEVVAVDGTDPDDYTSSGTFGFRLK